MASARIALPAAARSGEVIEIKTLITHPMETGYRRDSLGRAIPRNILTHFECRFDGAMVFKADLRTGVAANPYLAFSARVENATLPGKGSFEFIWLGQHDFVHRESRSIDILP